MIKLLLVLLSLTASVPFVYWEDLSTEEQTNVLGNINLNQQVLSFVEKEFIISDDQETEILLDTLSNLPKNTYVKALYFNLFNDILSESDGAASEMISAFCLSIIMSDADYVISYLKSNPILRKEYALSLGHEFFFKKEGTSSLKYCFAEFKEILDKSLCGKPEYREALSEFYGEIKFYMDSVE